MVTRFDVMFRVGPTSNTLTVNYNSTGDAVVSLTAGLYGSLALLCAQIQTQLQAVSAAFTCAEAAGVVTVAADRDFTITWTAQTLRDWLGFGGNKSGASTYGGTVSPGTWISRPPWDSDEPLGWEWTIKRHRGDHQQGVAIKLAKTTLWSGRFHADQSEMDHFRGVVSYLLRGQPARWWRDSTVAAAWSWTEWWGHLDVVMQPDRRFLSDNFADDRRPDHLQVRLDFVGWSA